jgi:HTH-type transcriptional regulator/antitoxin HigA
LHARYLTKNQPIEKDKFVVGGNTNNGVKDYRLIAGYLTRTSYLETNCKMEGIKLIKGEADYQAALKRIRKLWESPEGTPEAEEEEILTLLVKKYEDEHYPIEAPDPIEYIKIRMKELGLKQEDLVPYMGNKGNLSKALNRKRPLTLEMIRGLHRGFRFPLEVLIAEPAGK